MATVDKNFKIKNGLIVGDSTNLVNYTSSSPSGPFLGQLWISASSLYAWSSASAWVLIGDGDSGAGASAIYLTQSTASATYLRQDTASAVYVTQQNFDNIVVLQWMGIG